MSSSVQNGVDLSAAEKRALLADLLREKAARPKIVPTSFAQQRLWFLGRLEPGNSAYNIPRPLRINGELNVPVLRQTLNEILARHEVLRGSFDLIDGRPVQIIAPRVEVELPVIDLEGLPDSERGAEVSRLAIGDAGRPFDLTRAPLLRVCLLRLAPREHVLLLTMHHIVSDGWSMGVLVREIAAIYQAINAGEPADLPELPIQYADFARWQRDWLQGEILEEQLSYWKQQLSGAPAVLDLPIARPRPAMQTTRGAHISAELSLKLNEALNELSRREGVTLFMTLLAAFQTLLSRYSDQDDFVIGSPIAGRNRAELEGLIGFFVNSLPLRTSLAGNPSFRELLGRVKETALGAYAHQDLPFEKIVEGLQPPRSLSYPPIFQVMFALQNQPAAKFSLPGLELTPLKREFDTAKFDLTLFMTEHADGLGCWLEYNTDLFAMSAMARLLDHFQALLAAAVINPQARLSDLSLLSKDERRQLLIEWNEEGKKTTGFEQEHCLNQLFEQQARAAPEAVAVSFAGQQLTYRELNARANQLAHYLRKRGVGPETLVGLCAERSLELVVGLLATLKAGAGYLPLDPAYPRERLALMLEDSDAKVVLVQDHLRENLPGKLLTIALDSDRAVLEGESAENPENHCSPDNLAYVIYTSGSTGKPKGVSVTHRNVARLFAASEAEFNFNQHDVWTLFHSHSFDFSVWELWGALLYGGRLVVVPYLVSRSPEDFYRLLSNEGVTVLNQTPSAFRQLTQAEKAVAGADDLALRLVIFGGEALDIASLRPWFDRHGDQSPQLVNMYGITETTVHVTYRPLRIADLEQAATSVVGRALNDLQVYILDQHQELAPIGVPGQLYVGGAGLSRGYLKQPGLTAERFVPHRYASEPGARLYASGDLARYLENGDIEYLGRIDRQIKIRGFRIELGEIEAVLTQHDDVRDCIVIDRYDATGSQQLAAYFVASTAHQPPPEELRTFLKERLPDYMVPAFFTALEELPLTPNGKVDRNALPEPARRRSDQPRPAKQLTEIEFRLKRVWEEVLNVRPVGLEDNFFELGGHSMLAVRLISEIEKEFGRKIPLVSLFRTATIAGLADVLRQDAHTLSWPTFIEIQRGESKPPLFCVSMPNVNALGYRSLAQYLGPDQPVYGLQSQYAEDLEGEHSQSVVDELAVEYLEAVRVVQPRGPYQLVGMCRGAHIAFEMARRLKNDGQEVAFIGILDTWVLENTYNRFLYVEYYARRLRLALRLGRREQFDLIKAKTLGKANSGGDQTAVSDSASIRRANPMRAYFPGPDFQPKTYAGRVAVFRARKQPLNRISDKELGWGKLALGGVDLHYVPGKHGASVLREPNVQVLATEVKKRLIKG